MNDYEQQQQELTQEVENFHEQNFRMPTASDIIELNTVSTPPLLPYIKISKPPMARLVDIGCSKSIIGPAIIEKHFSSCIYRD